MEPSKGNITTRWTDTGALFWAGAGSESQPISEIVEAAYRSGLRAAAEVRAALETALAPT